MKRRASKLRSFVPKPVDRKVEGSEENETEDKLPELVSSPKRLSESQKVIIFLEKIKRNSVMQCYAPNRRRCSKSVVQWDH